MSRSLYSFISQYKPKSSILITRDFWGERKIDGTNVKFLPIAYF